MGEPVTETTFETEELHGVGSVLVHPRRELARRVSGGIEVTLYWSSHDDSTCVEVWRPASGETLLLTVARERALDAFYHPFAHLPTSFDDASRALDV